MISQSQNSLQFKKFSCSKMLGIFVYPSKGTHHLDERWTPLGGDDTYGGAHMLPLLYCFEQSGLAHVDKGGEGGGC